MEIIRKGSLLLQMAVLILSCIILVLLLVIVNNSSKEIVYLNCNGLDFSRNDQFIKTPSASAHTSTSEIPTTTTTPLAKTSTETTKIYNELETTTEWDDQVMRLIN